MTGRAIINICAAMVTALLFEAASITVGAAHAAPAKIASCVDLARDPDLTRHCVTGVYSATSSKVTLHAPVTLTITSGDVTLEGGSLTITPDGKAFQGGTMTVTNGAVVFDPQPSKAGKP